MKIGVGMTIGIVAAAAAAGGGYWLGNRGGMAPGGPAMTTAAAPGETDKKARRLLFYRNPMGLPDTSPVPKKDPMGMDYIAVYEGEEDGGSEPSSPNQVRISVGIEHIEDIKADFEQAFEKVSANATLA